MIGKRNKVSGIALSAIMALGLWGCSPRGNQVAAEETAEQIESARLAGREAARTFVNRQWKDTLELQGQLIEAGAKRAQYDSLPAQQSAYDSAFISTIRTVRPEVAAQLERYRKQ